MTNGPRLCFTYAEAKQIWRGSVVRKQHGCWDVWEFAPDEMPYYFARLIDE
jgi:hypothetical protein